MSDTVTSSTAASAVQRSHPSYVAPYDSVEETQFEMYSDYLLGGAFVITALVAAKRISVNRSGSTGAAESAVMTSFYSLIFVTAAIRALYFLCLGFTTSCMGWICISRINSHCWFIDAI
jgi:hypothetical protein